jgi:hypothetical protein
LREEGEGSAAVNQGADVRRCSVCQENERKGWDMSVRRVSLSCRNSLVAFALLEFR